MNYYKRHIGDYAKKAGHLTVLEHGIYTLLLDAYYDREQAPTHEEAVRVSRCRTPEELAALDAVLADFFTLSDGRYIQARVEEEFVKAEAQALANQANGKLGGRPRKPKDNRTKTHSVSSGNRTDSEKNPNPLIHQSKKEDQKTAPKGAAELLPGVSSQVAADFMALRQKLRAPVTKTAVAGILRESEKAGMTLEASLAMCCERGWRGFKAEWVNGNAAPNGAGRKRVDL